MLSEKKNVFLEIRNINTVEERFPVARKVFLLRFEIYAYFKSIFLVEETGKLFSIRQTFLFWEKLSDNFLI